MLEPIGLVLVLLGRTRRRRRGLAERFEELMLLTCRLVAMALFLVIRTLRVYTRMHTDVICLFWMARLTMTILFFVLAHLVCMMTLLVMVQTGALLGVVKLSFVRKWCLLATGLPCYLNGSACV